MEAERKKIVDAAREEALENAIAVIKAKIKEEQDSIKDKEESELSSTQSSTHHHY